MGLCGSEAEDPELKAEKLRSKKLQKQAQDEHEKESAIMKLLLLGAGESGKSTLFKQMISLYGDGFPEAERMTYKPVIYNNIISSMQTLVQAAEDGFGGRPIGCNEQAEFIKNMEQLGVFDENVAGVIKQLWEDEGIQAAYANRSKFQLTDSAEYFFEKVMMVAGPDYVPTEQDVLRSRVRTTGIIEQAFTIMGNQFKMFDVGGQRNERRKWIHCFEGVTAVLFVGVLSEYDMTLYEDQDMNRMEETLNLFQEICNSKFFRETSLILMLNKRDLFEEKIKRVPLTVCPEFADYTGPNTYEAGCTRIEESFLSRNRNPSKQIYTHVTCATDSNAMKVVFNATTDIVIRESLQGAGLV